MYEEQLARAAGFDEVQRELLAITWEMLNAINTGDAHAYARYTAPDLSCFEDVCDHRIDGLDFHISLIRQMSENVENRPTRFDMLSPRIQVYGTTGIVTYTRLMTYDNAGKPLWTSCNESRVFIKFADGWKMVHFHRTPV